MIKKSNIVIVVIICLMAMFLTFDVTFVLVSGASKEREAEIAEGYRKTYESAEKEWESRYESLEELYASLPEDFRTSEAFKKLSEVDAYYRNYYSGEIDEDELAYYTILGYIAGAGDRYGAYYSAEDFKAYIEDREGNSCGIGISVVLSAEGDAMDVLQVHRNSPADKAGIIVGDLITHVDDVAVTQETYLEILSTIPGHQGKEVKLTIKRGETTFDLVVTCDYYELVTVTYRQYSLDDTVGIIRIEEFNTATVKQFKDAVEDLISKGVKSIVFDVRSNPGGGLDSIVSILDYILPEGDIIYIKGKDNVTVEKFSSDANCIDPSIKMAVLVNGNTASAAELFTAALRDYNRATIVGVKTYGKGCMQSIIQLPDGAGLSLTTNFYNPPSDVNYDGIGIEPDIKIELDESLKNKSIHKISDEEDNQLAKAYDAVK